MESYLHQGVIPEGTLFALKCLPSNQLPLTFKEFPGQSGKDWSAIYTQFSLSKALAYLSNQYDRGIIDVSVVTLKTIIPVNYFKITHPSLQDPHVSQEEKALFIRNLLKLPEAVTPLLQQIGQQMKSVMILPDSEENIECAIPHCMITSEYFDAQPIVKLQRHSDNSLFTNKVDILKENFWVDLELGKHEKSDTSYLTKEIIKAIGSDLSSYLI